MSFRVAGGRGRVLETSGKHGVARDRPPFVNAGFGTLLPLKDFTGFAMLIDPRTFRRLVRVRERLLANDEISVAELAEQFGFSSSRLIRLFAAVFGTTPHQLRTEARIERARELLGRGKDVTTVCMEVGFSSLGSFSALFTRWTGTPPSRYQAAEQGEQTAPVVPGCLGMLASMPRNFREASIA